MDKIDADKLKKWIEREIKCFNDTKRITNDFASIRHDGQIIAFTQMLKKNRPHGQGRNRKRRVRDEICI
jgi:hypothetical protein